MEIAVFAVTKRPQMINNITENLSRQVLKPKLVIIYGDGFDVKQTGASHIQKMGIENVILYADKKQQFRLLQNRAINICTKRLPGCMACNFDDDDWYGPNYLLQVKQMKEAHPDAILIGKDSCPLIIVRDDREFQSVDLFRCSATNGIKSRQFAEATACIDSNYWNLWSNIRYLAIPEGAASRYTADIYKRWLKETYGETSDIYLQWRDTKYGDSPPNEMPWAPFYTTGSGEFLFRRFSDPGHAHTWKWFVPQSMPLIKKDKPAHGLSFTRRR
jgi:hypothetical protein